MYVRPLLRVFLVVGLAGGVVSLGTAQTQPPPRPQPPPPQAPATQAVPQTDQGVEVLTRGPVHEAFAEVTDVKVNPTPIVPKQPPAPVQEVPPQQKPDDPNVEWVPGYWAWADDRQDFIWVSGVWRIPPPGREWISGHWQQATGGWQWVPGFWASLDKNNEIAVYPPPPAPLDDAPPSPAPSPNSTYVPGIWVFEQGKYLWRPGFWVEDQPDWVWTPAHYLWAPAGAIFVEGYWDYPLANRGLLFAPVYLDRAVLGRPNWAYVPSYVVNTANLLDALFVRAGRPHYYFGNYFDARYQKEGFVPWVSAHIGRSVPLPLFSHYLHRPEGERWGREIRELYAARARGQGLPPRTLVEQNRAIENLRRDRTVNNAVINRTTIVHPLAQVHSQAFKLRPIPREEHGQLTKSLDWYRQVQAQRSTHAAQFLAHGVGAAERRPPGPSAIRLPALNRTAPRAVVKTPAAPRVPRHEERK